MGIVKLKKGSGKKKDTVVYENLERQRQCEVIEGGGWLVMLVGTLLILTSQALSRNDRDFFYTKSDRVDEEYQDKCNEVLGLKKTENK